MEEKLSHQKAKTKNNENNLFISIDISTSFASSSSCSVQSSSSNSIFYKIKTSSVLYIVVKNSNPQIKSYCLYSNYETRDINQIPYEVNTYPSLPPQIIKLLKYPIKSYNMMVFKLESFVPGPFFFQICFVNEATEYQFTDAKWILVHPNFTKIIANVSSSATSQSSLNISKKPNPIKPINIQIQSVLSKSLGKMKKWYNHFLEAKAMGFSHLHISSFQELGSDNNYFNLKCHNSLNKFFYSKTEKGLLKKEKLSSSGSSKKSRESFVMDEDCSRKFAEDLNILREKVDIGVITDLIVHQVSKDNDWIQENIDAGYNLMNTRKLQASYEFERVLINFSDSYALRTVCCEAAPFIHSEEDLSDLIDNLVYDINKAHLEEFFQIDIGNYIKDMTKFFYLLSFDRHNKFREKSKSLRELMSLYNSSEYDIISESLAKLGEKRMGVEINIEFIGNILYTPEMTEEMFVNKFVKIVKQINISWKQKIDEYFKEAIENIKNTIRVEFIQARNPKVTLDRKLISNYFTVYDSTRPELIFLNSGYISSSELEAESFSSIFVDLLRRVVPISKNSVMIRYSSVEKYESFIYKYMLQYVEFQASVSDGFVIESPLSVPLPTLEYLITKARKINPNLLLFCYFTEIDENAVTLIRRIGINYVIKSLDFNTSSWKESFKSTNIPIINTSQVAKYLIPEVKRNVLVMEGERVNARQLEPESCDFVVFDQNISDLTLYEKFNDLNYTMYLQSINSLSLSAIGTTKGFDELLPYQPSFEDEDREYLIDRHYENNINKLDKSDQLNYDSTEVKFEFTSNSSQVKIALSCFQWRPNIILQSYGNNKHMSYVNVPIGTHYYKYVLDDGRWVNDPNCPTERDSYGNANNVINVYGVKSKFTHLKLIRRQLNLLRKSFLGELGKDIGANSETRITFNIINSNSDEIATKICLLNNFNKPSDTLGYAFIWRKASSSNNFNFNYSVEVPGEIGELVIASRINVPEFNLNKIRCQEYLKGVEGEVIVENSLGYLNSVANYFTKNGKSSLNFHCIYPNSFMIIKLKYGSDIINSMKELNKFLNDVKELRINVGIKGLKEALNCLKLNENTDDQFNIYNLTGFGKIYPGVHRIFSIIEELYKLPNFKSQTNNPFVKNVMNGDWLLEFIILNLSLHSNVLPFNNYFFNTFSHHYKNLYPELKPHFFIMFVNSIFFKLLNYIWKIIKLAYTDEVYSQLTHLQLSYLKEIISSYYLGYKFEH